ncbi:MAG: Gfo/Idh/MocA family protein [Vulcanisaeta sp. AZ3]
MKVLIVGIGSMGMNHLRVLVQLKREGFIDNVYAVDVDQQRLKLAKDLGADLTFTDVTEALKYKPDLGIIAIPTKLHYGVARELIKYMDLLIEKPITDNLSDALELYRVSRDLGRRVLVGHIERFNPAYRALISEIGNKKPTYIETIRVGLLRGNPTTYGNVLLDLGIHDVDLVMNMIDEDRVEIIGKILEGDPVRVAWVLMRLGDITYVMHVSWNSNVRVRRITVLSTDKYYDVDLFNKVLFRDGVKHVIGGVDQLRQELIHAINVVRGIEKPMIDIIDGIKALAIIEGVLRNQQSIDVNNVLRLD